MPGSKTRGAPGPKCCRFRRKSRAVSTHPRHWGSTSTHASGREHSTLPRFSFVFSSVLFFCFSHHHIFPALNFSFFSVSFFFCHPLALVPQLRNVAALEDSFFFFLHASLFFCLAARRQRAKTRTQEKSLRSQREWRNLLPQVAP